MILMIKTVAAQLLRFSKLSKMYDRQMHDGSYAWILNYIFSRFQRFNAHSG